MKGRYLVEYLTTKNIITNDLRRVAAEIELPHGNQTRPENKLRHFLLSPLKKKKLLKILPVLLLEPRSVLFILVDIRYVKKRVPFL